MASSRVASDPRFTMIAPPNQVTVSSLSSSYYWELATHLFQIPPEPVTGPCQECRMTRVREPAAARACGRFGGAKALADDSPPLNACPPISIRRYALQWRRFPHHRY